MRRTPSWRTPAGRRCPCSYPCRLQGLMASEKELVSKSCLFSVTFRDGVDRNFRLQTWCSQLPRVQSLDDFCCSAKKCLRPIPLPVRCYHVGTAFVEPVRPMKQESFFNHFFFLAQGIACQIIFLDYNVRLVGTSVTFNVLLNPLAYIYDSGEMCHLNTHACQSFLATSESGDC